MTYTVNLDSEPGEFKFVMTLMLPLAAAALVGIVGYDYYTCDSKRPDLEHSWSVVSGCRVKMDHRWIPVDRIEELTK